MSDVAETRKSSLVLDPIKQLPARGSAMSGLSTSL